MPRYYSHEEVQELLWDYIKACGGVRKAARHLDVSPAYLYQYAAGGTRHYAPSAKLAKLFGLQKVVAYVGPNNLTPPPLPSPPAEKEPCSCPSCLALRNNQPLPDLPPSSHRPSS